MATANNAARDTTAEQAVKASTPKPRTVPLMTPQVVRAVNAWAEALTKAEQTIKRGPWKKV